MLTLIKRIKITKKNNIIFKRNFSSNNSKSDNNLDIYKLLISGAITLAGFSLYNQISKNINNQIIDKSVYEIKEENLDDIKKITVINNSTAICELKNSEKKIKVEIPEGRYIEDKLDIDVPVYYKNTIGLQQILPTLATFGLIGMMYYVMKRQMGGINNIIGNNNGIEVLKDIKIKFSDVIGQDNAKLGVKEFVEILKNKEDYQKIGVKVPKGALLSGPPGTGKTLLAKAIAGESELPFVNMSGSDFNAMFVGVGSAKIKNLYKQASIAAEEHGGCIVFIDEIDAIGQKRSSANTFGGNSERENTLNQLLTEMDGFEENKNVMTFAATNRPELLDPALIRPGRLDRKITVDLPTIDERESLFSFYLSKLNINQEIIPNISKIGSKLTPGFAGADISNICNESGILAVRNNRQEIKEMDIKNAIDYVMLGSERKNLINDKEKEIIAYHEAGHALLSYLLKNVTNPIKVSIIPREKGMLGFSQSELSSEVLKSKNEILDSICVLMGGRIAEEIFCQDITSGASNDIVRATQLAKLYIKDYSMGSDMSFMNLKNEDQFKDNQSEFIKSKIDQQVEELLNELYKKAKELLLNNKDNLQNIKNILIDKETIYLADIKGVIDK